jgi:hypothetical protein
VEICAAGGPGGPFGNLCVTPPRTPTRGRAHYAHPASTAPWVDYPGTVARCAEIFQELAGRVGMTGATTKRVAAARRWRAVPVNQADWERRVADAWASLDQRSEAELLALIEQLAAELPSDSGVGMFERAGALDSTGHPDLAVPLYRQALHRGLTGERRRRAPSG